MPYHFMYVYMEFMYRRYTMRLIYASPNLIINSGVPSSLCGCAMNYQLGQVLRGAKLALCW